MYIHINICICIYIYIYIYAHVYIIYMSELPDRTDGTCTHSSQHHPQNPVEPVHQLDRGEHGDILRT